MDFKPKEYNPGDIVPLVRFLYKPEPHNNTVCSVVKVGDPFPTGIDGEIISTDIGGMVFIYFDKSWHLVADPINPPIEEVKISGLTGL